MSVCLFVCMPTCEHVYVCVGVYVSLHTCIYVCMTRRLYAYVSICTSVFMHVCIFAYVHESK